MNYSIRIYWYQPYPKEWRVQEGGSNPSVAVSRAIKKWRKEEVPKKKIDWFKVEVSRL